MHTHRLFACLPPLSALFLLGPFLLAAHPATAQGLERGPLVIIGGGSQTPEMLDRIVELAGGEESRFAVVSAASSDPAQSGRSQADELIDHGAGSARVVSLSSTEDRERAIEVLRQVSGVFMTGGDQTRLTDALSGDSGRPVLRELERLLERGGVIAGTSAGAAVMGDLMITGNEMSVPEADLGFRQINAMTVERIDGFSFWKGVIVDQHFVWRRRHNRLLSLVLERPELVGVGIDEATAVVVDAEGNFEVIGLGTVTVYDGRGAQVRAPDAQGLPSAQNLRLHVLRAGDHFELGLQTHRPATE